MSTRMDFGAGDYDWSPKLNNLYENIGNDKSNAPCPLLLFIRKKMTNYVRT